MAPDNEKPNSNIKSLSEEVKESTRWSTVNFYILFFILVLLIMLKFQIDFMVDTYEESTEIQNANIREIKKYIISEKTFVKYIFLMIGLTLLNFILGTFLGMIMNLLLVPPLPPVPPAPPLPPLPVPPPPLPPLPPVPALPPDQ